MMPLPLIGIPTSVRVRNDVSVHSVHEDEITAAMDAAAGMPVLIPALGGALDTASLLARLDGLLVAGAISNIEPHHYGDVPRTSTSPVDPQRDATALPLIRDAIDAGVPLLAICRGMQELNVALGGSLHQQIHDLDGKMDHRCPPDAPAAVRFQDAHKVSFAEGGVLAGIAQAAIGTDQATVNSLHGQGIDRLAVGLVIEARAPDGIVEAVRVKDAPAFAIGIQWHPEWQATEDKLSAAIFRAFGDAARDRAQAQGRGG
ncbi:MAG: gamma-glutamyl-gamma-aminobutyrate hydrolase family protein [Alphaproteobacteria bacterium]